MIRNILKTLNTSSVPLKNYCTKLSCPVDAIRYVVKDKWNLSGLNVAIPNFKVRKPVENAYVVKKFNLEQKRCFRQIEEVKKKWDFQPKQSGSPQTFYHPEKPDLWKIVKRMYAPNELLFA